MFYYFDDINTINKALIIHSGALGDCVLTLKLACFLKEKVGVDIVNFLGPGEYISFMPGRTAIDGIRNIHTSRLERLFQDPKDFEVEEDDPLVRLFGGYNWIISFLGEQGSSFETNLAYLACFTSSPEIVILSAKTEGEKHISDFHIEELVSLKKPSLEALGVEEPQNCKVTRNNFITANLYDVQNGVSLIVEKAGSGCASDHLTIIAPGSGSEKKCWHIDNYLALADKLTSYGLVPVFLLGDIELERLTGAEINKLAATCPVLSSLSIEQVIAILSIAKLYIGNDSGISHISGAMELPTVSIFAVTDPRIYKPMGINSTPLLLENSSFNRFDLESVEKTAKTALQMINLVD